ncbi:MAG: tRNA 2-thiouridine(34) synthase MnmA [Omnitrophica WOR_2 bacterium RBG_13_41_10]|nr:MAG: tRNA 2-thiouridine(34) synthase MnmA [Omnitrophica WOR_2 bacterium RBG_13_41_10]
MKERIAVAMSGGVDSAVAAALLQKQGFEVIGITMCFNLPDPQSNKPSCCGVQGIEDARRVAHALGIKHYIVNMQKAFLEKVLKDFCQQYFRGKTPNPCIRCNQYIKFDALLKKAFSLGARYLATGHYARIEKVTSHKSQVTSYLLKKAKGLKKDQSYFLYRLKQSQLKHIIFPLSGYTKEEVRGLAQRFHLSVAQKPASQEICFLPDQEYRSFLKSRLEDTRPGYISDTTGKILGKHQGIAFYTIGQRQGLGIARGYPLYVTRIDARTNRIVVGEREQVYKRAFLVKQPHFILRPPKNKFDLRVRIRYNHPEAKARLEIIKGKIKVIFAKPQFAITPGQSAVFYDKNTVIGGGIIDEVLD